MGLPKGLRKSSQWGAVPVTTNLERRQLSELLNVKRPSPRLLAIKDPNKFKKRIAEYYAKKLPSILGNKTKAIYLIGSTASGMAAHEKDIDIAIIGKKPNSAQLYKIDEIKHLFERRYGTPIEVYFLNSIKDIKGEGILLKRLAAKGAEEFPAKIIKPETRERYKWAVFPALRAPGREGIMARVRFEQLKKREIADVIATLKKIIQDLPEPWKPKGRRFEPKTLSLLHFVQNYLILGGKTVKQYGGRMPASGYEDFQFILAHNRKFREMSGAKEIPATRDLFIAFKRIRNNFEYRQAIKKKLIESGRTDLIRFLSLDAPAF
ncbi:MAG: nucleotidyltransferase domain-containing protein [Candidatus Diapherotrites archaeon]|nr:nucleotidyltransferase domain-containing protein [Candidatus Diapherotrites archaeon]